MNACVCVYVFVCFADMWVIRDWLDSKKKGARDVTKKKDIASKSSIFIALLKLSWELHRSILAFVFLHINHCTAQYPFGIS